MRSKKNRGCTSSPRTIPITRPGNSAIRSMIAINFSNQVLPSHHADAGESLVAKNAPTRLTPMVRSLLFWRSHFSTDASAEDRCVDPDACVSSR